MMLDEQQKAVIYSNEKNILVVAGAGSGKTRVLTERVRRLLEEGVPPYNIVVITFTNLAAEELKERLSDIDNIGDAFIGTIHSFANRIYRTSGVQYKIADEETEQRVYYEVLHMPKYKDLSFRKWLKYRDLKRRVEQFKEDESVLNDFLLPSELNVLSRCREDVKRIYKRDGIITFRELLKHATEYFKSIGAHLEHLFVDELQDINGLEYDFIRALNAENYFFVGDDWQAIYGFKGGNVKIFKSLIEDDTFKKYYLVNNYRNPSIITKLGLQIINQAKGIIPKNIITMSKIDGIVTIHTKNMKNQMVDLLKKDLTNLRDWFVLTRTNKEAYELNEYLTSQGIDCEFIRKSDYSLAELRETMKQNKVKILTVHSSKGLESKKVILYGNFPIVQPRYLLDSEERKVMYVGVTRASEELHIFN